MTLQLDLKPDMEARLASEAAEHGMAPTDYALKLLDGSLAQMPGKNGILTPEDIEEMTRELTKGSENLPVLPPEANDRASYYEDRW